jgi:hypothetical protein
MSVLGIDISKFMIQDHAPVEVTVQIPCHVGWILCGSFDNTGNTASTIKRTIEITKSNKVKSTEFNKALDENSREEANE